MIAFVKKVKRGKVPRVLYIPTKVRKKIEEYVEKVGLDEVVLSITITLHYPEMDKYTCEECGVKIDAEDGIFYIDGLGREHFVCIDCFLKSLSWEGLVKS